MFSCSSKVRWKTLGPIFAAESRKQIIDILYVYLGTLWVESQNAASLHLVASCCAHLYVHTIDSATRVSEFKLSTVWSIFSARNRSKNSWTSSSSNRSLDIALRITYSGTSNPSTSCSMNWVARIAAPVAFPENFAKVFRTFLVSGLHNIEEVRVKTIEFLLAGDSPWRS